MLINIVSIPEKINIVFFFHYLTYPHATAKKSIKQNFEQSEHFTLSELCDATVLGIQIMYIYIYI